MIPENVAQGQLEAYNAHDIDLFCQYYADDIKVYDGKTGTLRFEGMKIFRERYTQRFATPDLHCTLVNRMVHRDIVIDQEEVLIEKNSPLLKAIAVYRIENGIIQEVRFY